MSSLKEKEGVINGPYHKTVIREDVDLFKKAIAPMEGMHPDFIPPTFLTSFRESLFNLLGQVGIELKQVLHAEQSYEFLRDVKVGDSLCYQSILKEVSEKKSKVKSLTFLYIDTEFTIQNQPQEIVALAKTTIVVRG